MRLPAHCLEPRYFPEWAFFNVRDDRERKGCERCLSGVATVPLEPIGKQLERWAIAALLFASSASAALGLGCGTTPPLGRVIGREDVEGETAVAAIYRFAHRNDICVGLALDDNALLPPLARTHFQNTSVSAVLRKLLPRSYRAREQGRVVLIEPVKGAPAWLSQQIDRFRLQRPEPDLLQNADRQIW